MRYGKPVVHANKHYRSRMRPGKDRKTFSRSADMTNDINMRKSPMRGGYRL